MYLRRVYPLLAEARVLASLAGIRSDLADASSYCEELIAQADENYIHPVRWDSLTIACIVSYARCFKTGVRANALAEALDAAPQDLQQLHQWMIDVRDKHVAHSVNNFEENRLVVSMSFEGLVPVEVDSVGIEPIRYAPIHFDLVRQIASLLEWASGKAEELFNAEALRLRDHLRRTDLKELAKFAAEPLPAVLNEASITKRRPSA